MRLRELAAKGPSSVPLEAFLQALNLLHVPQRYLIFVVACSRCFFEELQMTVSMLMFSKLRFNSLCQHLSSAWEVALLELGAG